MTGATRFRFSAEMHPHLHPIEAMRLIWGPVQVRTEDGSLPQFWVKGLALPGLAISALRFSPTEVFKPPGADTDDITLSVTRPSGDAQAYFKLKSTEECAGGGAVIIKHVENECLSSNNGDLQWHAIRIPRSSLAPLLDRGAKLILNRVSAAFPAVGLLRHYIEGLLENDTDLSGMETIVAAHIRDLAALVIGASRDGRHQAIEGGVMAARREIAKKFVRANLMDCDLSDETVGTALRISPSYVRKLFVGEGGFRAFLIHERLAHAHRLLTSPPQANAKVIDIAFRCGFSSLQTFNRQFRATYGMSPSEARMTSPFR